MLWYARSYNRDALYILVGTTLFSIASHEERKGFF